MIETAKMEIMNSEGDAYFDRNMNAHSGKLPVATGCKLFEEFLNYAKFEGAKRRVLEIGACYGYNLVDIHNNFQTSCYGIEPSKKAVDYGNEIYKDKDIHLKCGTSDLLDFEDDFFDIVMIGFSFFWVERKLLLKSVAEADRVLKFGGFLAIYDFDTKLPYIRENVHNQNVPTYKMDMVSLFLSNPQYYLAEKRCFTHHGIGFDSNIQERCALNVFYKAEIDEAYIRG